MKAEGDSWSGLGDGNAGVRDGGHWGWGLGRTWRSGCGRSLSTAISSLLAFPLSQACVKWATTQCDSLKGHFKGIVSADP